MFTWYSVMRPLSQRTCCSLTHAPRIPRSVLLARARPSWMASSKLFCDVALISDTLATDMTPSSIRSAAPAGAVGSLPDASACDLTDLVLRAAGGGWGVGRARAQT